MDNILVVTEDNSSLRTISDEIISALQDSGFIVVEERMGRLPQWKYFGYQITEQTLSTPSYSNTRQPEDAQ